MSFKWWMDTPTMVCLYNGTLFSNKKKEIIDTRSNMDDFPMYYAKWKKLIWKGYIQNYSLYIPFWKKQTHYWLWSVEVRGMVDYKGARENFFSNNGNILCNYGFMNQKRQNSYNCMPKRVNFLIFNETLIIWLKTKNVKDKHNCIFAKVN